MKHWLITAFEPFSERPDNFSIDVLRQFLTLPEISGLKFHSKILPTSYDRCFLVLKKEIDHLQSMGIAVQGVLSIGESREVFQIETQANNLDHAPHRPDNDGITRNQSVIYPKLAKTISMKFPFDCFLTEKWLIEGVGSSLNPGNFVCNHLCVRATHELISKESPIKHFGFIHVPRQLQQVWPAKKCAQFIWEGFEKLENQEINAPDPKTPSKNESQKKAPSRIRSKAAQI